MIGRIIAVAFATSALLFGVAPRAAHAQSLQDWSGFWIGEGLRAEISGFPSGGNYKLLGGDAPWSEVGRARMEAAGRRRADQKANGWGFPLMMNSAAPLQFLITPRETLMINVYRDVRHVYTDGRSLPVEDDRWPRTAGGVSRRPAHCSAATRSLKALRRKRVSVRLR